MPDHDAVIIGAGFAGMYQLHKLRGLGFDGRCLELLRGDAHTVLLFSWCFPGCRAR